MSYKIRGYLTTELRDYRVWYIEVIWKYNNHQKLTSLLHSHNVLPPFLYKKKRQKTQNKTGILQITQYFAEKLRDKRRKQIRIWTHKMYLTFLIVEGSCISIVCILTLWGQNKMAANFLTTFSNAFSWMKTYRVWIRFYWRLLPRV